MAHEGQWRAWPDEAEGALTFAEHALAEGRIVGIPTETFYGLAVSLDHAQALASLCQLKQRGPYKPMPLVAADLTMVQALCQVPDAMAPLVRAFWPGSLTLALPARGGVDPRLLAPDGTVGVRVSPHPFVQALCARWGAPLTATSANFAGQPPSATYLGVAPALRRQVAFIDGGPLPGGAPSTVVAQRADGQLTLVRAGAISRAALAAVVGEGCIDG